MFDTKGFEKRAMMEPTVENVNKGPRDSFIENYRTNTATIRRKIKSPDLMIEHQVIGTRTQTSVAIVYIKSITNDQILQETKNRLNAMQMDNLLSTSIIEDALSNYIACTFPQVVTTERPDKFSADILEGRVGIIVDGIPFGFVVPATFNQLMQTPEDYSRKSVISSFIRIIRHISLIMAIFFPALYVAITTFHLELIPTNIILFIAKSREGVAFPVAIETIALLIAFEILYEAGLRIPKSVGQTVSIVGTLVVGQAAVEAKLISPSVIVVVAMTIIASFTVPNQDFANAIRLWRLVSTVAGIFLGLLGVVCIIILLIYELCKLNPFGVPYMAPYAGIDGQNMLTDSIIRIPAKDNIMRPVALNPKDSKRRGG
jgi:spore germination protein KA